MIIKDRINQDLKTALLAGDQQKVTILRGLKAVILNEEVAENSRDSGLEDKAIEQLLAKELKKRNESISIYKQANRQELVDQEEQEAKIIVEYLPKQISEVEIAQIIDTVIDDLGDSPNIGQIIGEVKSRAGSAADGGVIAKLVKERYSQ